MPNHYTDKEIFNTIKAAADEAKGPYLSQPAYKKFLKSRNLQGPSTARITQRFGSWSEACLEAGVTPQPPTRRKYVKGHTVEGSLQALQKFIQDTPETKDQTYLTYDAWRTTQPGAPSPQTVRNLFNGSWSEALRQAKEIGQ